jgi:hypothetical protein
MFDDDYLKKLRKYLGKEIIMSVSNYETRIYVDTETKYFLRNDEYQYVLILMERGCETELAKFQTKTEMKRNFALWMKSIFGNNIKYPYADKFEGIENLSLFKELMYQYLDKELFSIDNEKENKIILTKNQDGSYNIFYLDRKGKKYFIEENEEAPFVFERFYSEVEFYGEMIQRVNEYEFVFEDKLNDNIKIQLLGY